MLQLTGGVLLAAWLVAVATSHTFGGWIHLLPVVVLLGGAARLVYVLLTLD